MKEKNQRFLKRYYDILNEIDVERYVDVAVKHDRFNGNELILEDYKHLFELEMLDNLKLSEEERKILYSKQIVEDFEYYIENYPTKKELTIEHFYSKFPFLMNKDLVDYIKNYKHSDYKNEKPFIKLLS